MGVTFCQEICEHILAIKIIDKHHAPSAQIVIIFVSFALMDLCHDLLLVPSRAFLNDQLSDAQLDVGNTIFSLVGTTGYCVGFIMVLNTVKSRK